MMNARSLFAISTLVLPLAAQETYWTASGAGTIQVDAAGVQRQTVTPGSARDLGVGPDGKVWALAAAITVFNADGTFFRTITPTPGVTPYSIAFDKQGHAWVTSTTNLVEEFDALGNSLGTITLPASSARVITVDADGNKWIGHRVGPPGSVSRIDGATRAVTNHLLPVTSRILPITVYADARGPATPSHIWVVGDNRGAGELVELDATGTVLNTYVLGTASRVMGLAGDVDATGVTKNMWVADWGNGDLFKVDVGSGIATNLAQGGGVISVNIDGFGNPWATFRAGGLRRIDPATGNAEVDVTGTMTTALSTRWQYATVVDPLGDLDGDGAQNLFEVTQGSSPFDTCSTPAASLSVEGSTRIGANTSVQVRAAAGSLTGIAFAGGTVSPGISIPGIGCTFQLDLATFLPVTVSAVGPAILPFTIPSNPFLTNRVLAMQGLNANGTSFTFTNATAMLFH